MKDEVLCRPWLHPEFPWRAIDSSGLERYYKQEPIMEKFVWAERDGFWPDARVGEKPDVNIMKWARIYWQDSKQHISDYQKIKDNEQ